MDTFKSSFTVHQRSNNIGGLPYYPPNETMQDTLPTDLEQEFIRLKRLWNEETSGVSSVTRILLNHHYLKIISLGPKVIPLILAELSKKPDHWFVALAVLSDSDPTEPGFTFTEATDAWLKWGREKGYLAD